MSSSSLNGGPQGAVVGAADDSTVRTLDDSLHSVKVQAFHLRKSLNPENPLSIQDNLKYLFAMLSEMKSELQPKAYYELYMAIFNELNQFRVHLSQMFPMAPPSSSASEVVNEGNAEQQGVTDSNENVSKLDSKGLPSTSHQMPDNELNCISTDPNRNPMANVYELSQYSPSIIPRLYAMITIGSYYLSFPDSPQSDLLMDMLDMCKGVQHPIRGLFLRYYLQQCTKDIEKYGLLDAIFFVLQNFMEMNKLWVRLQYLGHSRDRERREQERRDLRILVGTNLVRLSQMEGLDLKLYKQSVLPKLLEQIVQCRDVIAQEYLMEALVQVFQDEFHLRTLDQLLSATGQLHPSVNIKQIIINFIDRLSAFAKRLGGEAESTAIPDEVKLFEVFWEQASLIMQTRMELTAVDVAQLLLALTRLASTCYPEKMDYMRKLLQFGADKFTSYEPADMLKADNVLAELLQQFMDTYSSLVSVLVDGDTAQALKNYLAALPFQLRYRSALLLVRDLLEKQTRIEKLEYAELLLQSLLGPLVRDQKDGGIISGTGGKTLNGYSVDFEQWREDQTEFSRALHLFHSEDCETQFQILNVVRGAALDGGVDRMTGTVPVLVTLGMQLARAYHDAAGDLSTAEELEKKMSGLLKFLHQTIAVLQKAEQYPQALRLFLQPLTDPSSLVGMEMLAYEFIVQAFSIYEDAISESREQTSLLLQMIGTVLAASNTGLFSNENYDTLATKLTLYSSKLLKKPDQCRMVYRCAHLFWGQPMTEMNRKQIQRMLAADTTGAAPEPEERWFYRDGKRVLECLQKALKIADACMDSLVNVELFIEILRQYAHFYQLGNPAVTLKYVNGLVDLIYSNMLALHSDPTLKAASAKPAKVDENNPDSPMAPRIQSAAVKVNASTSDLAPRVSTESGGLENVARLFAEELRHIISVREEILAEGSEEDRLRWQPVEVAQILEQVIVWTSSGSKPAQ